MEGKGWRVEVGGRGVLVFHLPLQLFALALQLLDARLHVALTLLRLQRLAHATQ